MLLGVTRHGILCRQIMITAQSPLCNSSASNRSQHCYRGTHLLSYLKHHWIQVAQGKPVQPVLRSRQICTAAATAASAEPARMTLTLLTWNVSEAANSTSDQAPRTFTAHGKVKRVAAAISQHSPDIVALQEATLATNKQTLTNLLQRTHSYRLLGTARSHCGQVCLLVKRSRFRGPAKLLQADGLPCVVARFVLTAPQTAAEAEAAGSHQQGEDASQQAAGPSAVAAPASTCTTQQLGGSAQGSDGGSAVAATAAKAAEPHQSTRGGRAGILDSTAVTTQQQQQQQQLDSSSTAVYVACCHLEPFKEGAALRAKELTHIVKAITRHDPAACVLIAGDMNMRENETVIAQDLGLQDAWLLSDSNPSAKFTWNSKVNQYMADCFGFTCRFDRVFVSRGVQVQGFSLVGDQPVEGQPGHYLSDHFGIVMQLQLPV